MMSGHQQHKAKVGGAGAVASLFRVDRRMKLGRRITEKERLFTAALGGEGAVTPVVRERISIAAQLAVVAEVARDKFLRGDDGINPDDLVRLTNQARLAERALRIPEKKPAPNTDALSAYLAAKSAPA